MKPAIYFSSWWNYNLKLVWNWREYRLSSQQFLRKPVFYPVQTHTAVVECLQQDYCKPVNPISPQSRRCLNKTEKWLILFCFPDGKGNSYWKGSPISTKIFLLPSFSLSPILWFSWIVTGDFMSLQRKDSCFPASLVAMVKGWGTNQYCNTGNDTLPYQTVN